MSGLEVGLGLAFGLAGSWVAADAVYLAALAGAASFYRPPPRTKPRTRLVVLVPAHDEAESIAECIRSLAVQTYPSSLYDVVVVADNCSDETAAIARRAGAEALVRHEPDRPGKGQALAWAFERLDEREPRPDGAVVVDADSIADPDFLTALVAPFDRGAQAVQGESLLRDDGTPAARLRAIAFLLVNRVLPAGRTVLRVPGSLAGNGMLLSHALVRALPWDAFTSTEDVEYSAKLRLAGINPAFAGGAILRSPTAPTAEAARQQQLRWEGGKLNVARTQLRRFLTRALRERRPSLAAAAFDLAVPPTGLLAAAAVGGIVPAAALYGLGVLPLWSLAPWVVALVAMPLYVLAGLRAARAPRWAYRTLVHAPLFVAGKTLSAHRLLAFRPDTWVRTERSATDDASPSS